MNKWLTILKALAPIVLALIPQIPKPLIPIIVDTIGLAEQSEQTGPEKLTAVVQHPELSRVSTSAIVDGVTAVVAAVNAIAK